MTATPRLTVDIAGLRLKNPIMPGSGTWGYGEADPGLFDLDRLGAVVLKSVTVRPRRGNRPLRLVETPAGMLNSIGIPSPGVDHYVESKLPEVGDLETVKISSVAGTSPESFGRGVQKLGGRDAVDALELNLSCPNLGEDVIIAEDEGLLRETVAAAAEQAGVPVIAKLSPNVTSVVRMAEIAADAGADALTVANTFRGMAIDTETCEPLLGNIVGGLSGPSVRPLVVRMVWDVAEAVDVPIIASGGVSTAEDAVEMLAAGAAAVQVGTANFTNPEAMPQIIDGLGRYLRRQGMAAVQDLIGRAHRRTVDSGEELA